MLKKCENTGQDPQLAFLFLRTTPVDHKLPSPAELLYERPIRSTLPFVFRLKSKYEDTQDILKQRQNTQKLYFDKNGCKNLPELHAGDLVMLQDTNNLRWKPATVVSPTKEPRSYIVQTTEGTRYRRNRRFLKELKGSTCYEDPEGKKTREWHG